MRFDLLSALALALLAASPVSAADDGGNAPMSPAFLRAMEPMIPRESASERTIVTRHTILLDGKALPYRAIVTELPMPGADGAPVAEAVSYAYVADGVKDVARRPVVFVFNGGPGASSSPLHMQAIGPRRMVGKGAGAHLEDNRFTLLDRADLVFIDPVGTGASMPLKGRDASAYFGVGGDARGVSQIITRWLTAQGRTASPVVLMGESYGTARALAILNENLKAGTWLPDGVVLLSLAIGDSDGPVVADTVLLPTLSAVAWYHGAIPREGRSVQEQFDRALHFAQTTYASALMQGPALPEAAKHQVAQELAALIGIPAATLEQANLRLDKRSFMLTLLAGQGLRTGQLDARVTRKLSESNLRPPFDDPSMSLGSGSTSPVERYLEDELGYRVPSPYRSLNLGINFRWNWDKDYGGSYQAASFAPYLREAMAAKPGLRVFAAGGYFDVTTPVEAGRFALEQRDVPGDRTEYHRYAAGHSTFEDEAALANLSADLHAFVDRVGTGRK